MLFLIKSDATHQVDKAGVVSQRFREGLHLDPLQNVRPLLIGSVKPGKYFVVLAETNIGLNERCSRNIALLAAFFQFINQAKRVGTSPGMSVGSGQNADGAWTSMSYGNSFLEGRNGILGLFLTYE